MKYSRMTIEKEAPEEVGAVIRYNLSESAITDQTLSSLQITIPPDLLLTYTEHPGSPQLRSLIAEALSDGKTITAKDVLVTAGASTSLFIVATAILEPGDGMIVTRPNYATSLETPRAIGCDITYIDLDFEQGFRVDMGQITSTLRRCEQEGKRKPKLISVCSPNNPTGTMLSAEEMFQLSKLAREEGCWLLVDETYRDLIYEDGHVPTAAATYGDHVIGVSSLSKAFGVPGIRIGWLTTTNPHLYEQFLAAKEQISICGSALDELVAEQVLLRRGPLLSTTRAEMLQRRDRVHAWIQAESDRLEYVRPQAGVMCFVHIKKTPVGGLDAFYTRLLEQYGTYIGPGRWFERDDSWFRLGFGWPTSEDLEIGLNAISKALG